MSSLFLSLSISQTLEEGVKRRETFHYFQSREITRDLSLSLIQRLHESPKKKKNLFPKMKNNNNKSSSSSSYDSSLSPSSSSSSHQNWLSFSLSNNNNNFNSSSNPNLTSSTSDHHHPHPSHLSLFQAFSTSPGFLSLPLSLNLLVFLSFEILYELGQTNFVFCCT